MRLGTIGTLCTVIAIAAAAIGGIAACEDDTATVRERFDAGAPATDAGDEGGALACGVAIPTTYGTAAFAANAAVELALAAQFRAISEKMRSAEGESTAVVTAAELKGILSQGNPSLRAVSTPGAQVLVDGYFDAFEAAAGKTWTPADAIADGGAPSGGKYASTGYFSALGVDLREATEKTLLGGALYNHVLGLVSAPMTQVTVDRLVAAFGATTALANRTDDDAGAEQDTLVAEYASKRDDKSFPTPGAYRKVKNALLTMKAALLEPEKCKPELDAAIAIYLSEWERVSLATAINYLNAASLAAADPGKGPQALHAYGEALGFIQGFKGIAADRRKIQDAQIDALLDRMGAATAYRLVTNPGDRAAGLAEAIKDIALYEGFTADEVDGFKKTF